MDTEQLKTLVVATLEDRKGVDIRVLDVRGKTTVTDYMVVVTGTSDRQLKTLAQYVVEKAKEQGVRPLGVEGERHGEWVLVDLGDVVVHIMLARVREFYDLEKLWAVGAPRLEESRKKGAG